MFHWARNKLYPLLLARTQPSVMDCKIKTNIPSIVSVSSSCRPLCPVILSLFTKYIDAQSTLGHCLYIANSNPSTKVVYCIRCGSYGTHRFANLGHPGRAHTSGQTGRLPHFANKTHPNGTTLEQLTQVSFGFIQTLCSQPTVEDFPNVCQTVNTYSGELEVCHEQSDPDLDQDDLFGEL
jgi:hypothetical protein